jgi:hypothetical protein
MLIVLIIKYRIGLGAQSARVEAAAHQVEK